MNNNQLKTKSFDTIKKLESDGWELLVLDFLLTTMPKSPDSTTWFAVMVKDGLHIYVEIEPENKVHSRDVKMQCPDCGCMKYDGTVKEGSYFCPDCNTQFVYKKEIVEEYIALAGQASPPTPRVLPCCTGGPQGIIKSIQIEIDRLRDVKMIITEHQKIQYELLEQAHLMLKEYKR